MSIRFSTMLVRYVVGFISDSNTDQDLQPLDPPGAYWYFSPWTLLGAYCTSTAALVPHWGPTSTSTVALGPTGGLLVLQPLDPIGGLLLLVLCTAGAY